MIDKEEFNKAVSNFEYYEGRGVIYWRAKEIIKNNPEYITDAIILLLSTWNFAHMSGVFKGANKWKFDYKKIEEDVKKILPYFKKFEMMDIRTAKLDDLERDISEVYDVLKNNCNIRYVGATKIMMLLNDNLFVAWDTAIKKWKKIYGTESGDYLKFLALMQHEFGGVSLYGKANEAKGFAKAIDEYNFQKAPRKSKKKRS